MKKAAPQIARFAATQGAFVNADTEDLRQVQTTRRKLQKAHGKPFWRLEQIIGRIDDELERREP